MNKKILWGLAILGVVLGGWALVGGNHQSAPVRLGGTTNFDALTLDNGNLTLSNGTVTQSGTTFTANNITQTYSRISSFTAATSTGVCVIATPAATSSLTNFTMNITTGTSSIGVFAVGTSTLPLATSSSLVSSQGFAAGAQGAIGYVPTLANRIIGPSQYIVAGMTVGSALGTGTARDAFTYGGTCNATFQSVN